MREPELLRRCNRTSKNHIESLGLKLQFHYGVVEWRAFMEEHHEHDPFISTAFDHKANPLLLDMSNSAAWLVLDGLKPIAGVAVRAYHSKLRSLIDYGGLWLPDKDIVLSEEDAGFDSRTLPDDFPLDAHVTQRGGLFVAPGYERRGIGGALSWASNALAFQIRPDWEYSVALKKEDHDDFSDRCAYLGEARIGTPMLPFWLAVLSRRNFIERLRGKTSATVLPLRASE